MLIETLNQNLKEMLNYLFYDYYFVFLDQIKGVNHAN